MKYKKTAIAILFILIICSYFFSIFYYSPSKEIDNYEIRHHHDDTLRIAFIGDSWAFFHKHHKCQMDSIISNIINKPIKVFSDGTCGATSKFIYSRFGANGHIQEIMKEGPNYCIIAAGVNDTHLKIGEKYYLHNMKLIIDFMIQHDIIPIILEIPDYDIYKVYDDIHLSWEEAVEFFMAFANADCDKIAIENPVGVMSTRWRKPDQIVQPYFFGDPFEKRTCLWLKGLPKLKKTNEVTPPERSKYKSGCTMPTWYANLPAATRAKERSKTFPGFAEAMAEQWGTN